MDKITQEKVDKIMGTKVKHDRKPAKGKKPKKPIAKSPGKATTGESTVSTEVKKRGRPKNVVTAAPETSDVTTTAVISEEPAYTVQGHAVNMVPHETEIDPMWVGRDYMGEALDSAFAFKECPPSQSNGRGSLAYFMSLLPSSPLTPEVVSETVMESDLTGEEVGYFLNTGSAHVDSTYGDEMIDQVLNGELNDPLAMWAMYVMVKLSQQVDNDSSVMSQRPDTKDETVYEDNLQHRRLSDILEDDQTFKTEDYTVNFKGNWRGDDFKESDKKDIQIGSYLRRTLPTGGQVVYFNQGGKVYETFDTPKEVGDIFSPIGVNFCGRRITFGESLIGRIGGDPEPEGQICDKVLPKGTYKREYGFIYIQGMKCYKVKDEGQTEIVGLGGSRTVITLIPRCNEYKIS